MRWPIAVVITFAGCMPYLPSMESLSSAQKPTPPLESVHAVFVDGDWQQSDDSAWHREGERRAVLDYAARRLGCRVSDLTADKRSDLWIVDGCGRGVFANVTQWRDEGTRRLATEFFVDIANEDPDTAWDAMVRAVHEEGRWLVQSDAGDVVERLARLVAINAAAARVLQCPRSGVTHERVSLRGASMIIGEGCQRRATFLDSDPRSWRLLSIVDLAAVDAK